MQLTKDLESLRITFETEEGDGEFHLKVNHQPDFRILQAILDRDYYKSGVLYHAIKAKNNWDGF